MLLPTTRIGRKRNLNRTKLTRMSTISRVRVLAGRRPTSSLPHQEVTSSDGFLFASASTAVIRTQHKRFSFARAKQQPMAKGRLKRCLSKPAGLGAAGDDRLETNSSARIKT